jgi:hypothetical protein
MGPQYEPPKTRHHARAGTDNSGPTNEERKDDGEDAAPPKKKGKMRQETAKEITRKGPPRGKAKDRR